MASEGYVDRDWRRALANLQKSQVEAIPSRTNTISEMKDYALSLEIDFTRLSFIHVAGTNGKGSTCAFAESILRHCGYRTGLYTSPHLIHCRERFRIDGTPVSEAYFEAQFWLLYDKIQRLMAEGLIFSLPGFFRFLTLLAFSIFIDRGVDVVVLEVGLGGRLDATNVVFPPSVVVCGISMIGFDHQELLGHSLSEIATEKAGIFKRGVPAFTVFGQTDEVMATLERCAEVAGVMLGVVQPLGQTTESGLGLSGNFQAQNAALAVALTENWLDNNHSTYSPEQQEHIPREKCISDGLLACSWPGRCQVFEHPSLSNITFYLDGAHTAAAMNECARWFLQSAMRSVDSCTKLVIIFNCSPLRDPKLLFSCILRHINPDIVHQFCSSFFISCPSNYDRSSWQVLPSSIANEDQQSTGTWQAAQVELFTKAVEKDANHGWSCLEQASVASSMRFLEEIANSDANTGDACNHHVKVLITGSLYLVGSFLHALQFDIDR